MSALGQKRTFAVQNGMSALPPKADIEIMRGHPGSNACWVSAKDELSLSLLQVGLIDLRMPIKIVQGV